MDEFSDRTLDFTAGQDASRTLQAALAELLRIYDREGPAAASAEACIEAEFDRGAGRATHPQHHRQDALLRARDLHRFVTQHPGLVRLKVQVLEALLAEREPDQRWNAARAMLLGHLLDGAPCTAPDVERCKLELTQRGGALGSLLQLIALFNLDAGAERPPRQVALRYVPGGFPDHVWAQAAPADRRGYTWSPRHALCRWEYLAADLVQHLVTNPGRGADRPEAGAAAGSPRWAEAQPSQQLRSMAASAAPLYCRFEDDAPGTAASGQMPLFPADPQALVIEILRRVHKQLGAEGVRQLALLMSHLAAQVPGRPAELNLEAVALSTGEAGLAPRAVRLRAAKLARVLDLLGTLLVHRVRNQHGQATLSSTRLVTILGRESPYRSTRDAEAPSAGSQAGSSVGPSAQALRVELLVDALFYPREEHSLGESFRRLPRTVLAENPRQHPYLIALALHVRGLWERQGDPVVQRAAGALLTEAGLWVAPTSRYRSLEQLKRDLNRLQELGVLGRWRLARGAQRDAWQDQLRLEAPGPDRSAGMRVAARAAAE